jgi:hypothetical protein
MYGRTDDGYHHRRKIWLQQTLGLALEEVYVGSDEYWEDKAIPKAYQDGTHPDLPEFYIVAGMSPRLVSHAVIYSKGKLVHDPHYSGDGIISVDYVWMFKPVEGTRYECPKSAIAGRPANPREATEPGREAA